MSVDLPPFPTTVVGSLPRTDGVKKALRRKQRGKMEQEEFDRVADGAALEALRLQEAAGLDVVSDGEQRRDNFYSFIAEHIAGIRLMPLVEMLDYVEDKAAFEQLLGALDVPAFALKNPVVTGELRRESPLALDEYRFLKQHTDKPVKVALPGPYLLSRSMWVKGLSERFYPDRESLADAVVGILREELEELAEAGCSFVQFDEPVLTEVAFTGPHETHTFMCAALSEKASPEEELGFAVDLINRVLAGINGDVKTALHVCRGNWSRRDDVLLRGSYEPLIPHLSRMDVDQLVLEYATERAGSIEALSELPKEKEVGLGVVDPRTPATEDVEAVVNKVRPLLEHRRPEQIYLNPDCGFGTFADRPVNDPETAAEKLGVISRAAGRLRAELS